MLKPNHGTDGTDSTDGATGISGTDGTDGSDGSDGVNGSTGTTGSNEMGDSCANPKIIAAAPFTETASTASMQDDFSYEAGECLPETGGWGSGSPDVVYSFTPTADGVYTITLTPDFDSNLYIVSDCNNAGPSCIAGDEQVGSGVAEKVLTPLSSGTNYFIVVDGWGAGASGSYTLEIR